MRFVDLKRQYLAYKEDLDQAIRSVVESSTFVLGEQVVSLEEELAQLVGQKGAVGVASGTDALYLTLMAMGVGPGDGVITSPFTFIATAEVIALLGARPIFSDIEPDTFNLDPESLKRTILRERASGTNLKGIIAVSLFGQVPDMDEILHIARAHQLFVIEDGCQSLGATYKGRPSCGLTPLAVTSFFPSKPLGCYGDGGMVFASDPHLLDEIRCLRNHGQKRRYLHERIGTNSRLDALQAAILRAKRTYFEEEVKKRQLVAKRYTTLIKEVGVDVITPTVRPDRESVFAQYTIRVKHGLRDKVKEHLHSKGIPTAVHYPIPLHLQPCFKPLGYTKGDFPQAEQAAQEVLSLPMHPFLTLEEQEAIVNGLKEALKECP